LNVRLHNFTAKLILKDQDDAKWFSHYKILTEKNAAVMHNSTFINISKQRIKSYQTEAA